MNHKKLQELLNLNIETYTNQTYAIGKYDFPYVLCPENIKVDYLALYSDKKEYCKTKNTAVCFYEYDKKFDGINGLYNAIYYNDDKLLKNIKKRFNEVKCIIAPDYSQCGDIQSIENYYRLFKARIVSLWFTLEMSIPVIPNITYANENYFDCMLDGMEDVSIVSFSLVGSIKNKSQKNLLIKAIKQTIDCLKKLKKIIVYSVCLNDQTVYQLFSYPLANNIKVVIPNNKWKSRNLERSKKYHGQI